MLLRNRKKYAGKDLKAMSTAQNYHKWILSEFRPFLGRKVAEVGAGSGNITEILIEDVDSLNAYEPSANIYSLLQKRFDHISKVKTINNFFGQTDSDFKEEFDTIIYINVLEHIENDREELVKSCRALERGGNLLVFVPALSALYSKFDKRVGHYRRYHKADLEDIAQEAGFEIVKLKYFDLAGTVAWYLFFVIFDAAFTPGKVSLYDKMVIPLASRLEKAVTPPFGKNLLLVARKQ